MVEEALFGQPISEQTMFADSLLGTAGAQRSRRSWTTLTSFGLQAVLIASLLAIPMLRNVGLPLSRVVSIPISLGSPDAPPVATQRSGSPSVMSTVAAIPRFVPSGHSSSKSKPGGGAAEVSSGGDTAPIIGFGSPTEGLPMNIAGTRPVLPAPPAPSTRTFRTSSMLEGSLIERVQPAYPPFARTARIQGQVVLAATISKTGTIENLQVVSGHPMLVRAALDAVSQWRYRPYILNHEPVEVETQIVVNFSLGNQQGPGRE